MRRLCVVITFLIYSNYIFCQADAFVKIKTQATSTKTDAKPQSKVWTYQSTFFAVFPDKQGTFIWKLADQQWVKHLKLTPSTTTKADCLAKTDSVFLLLFDGANSKFCALQFNQQNQKYQFLIESNSLIAVPFDNSVETATIAIDSRQVLWMTFETNNNIVVRQSDPPYIAWSNPQIIFSGVANDDISAAVNMSGSIGIFWSDQISRRFGFKFHIDGDPISQWSTDEIPASQSALNIGEGMADDHLNIKFSASGQIFVAIKTSYDTPRYTKIGLLVRRENGKWDDLYHVSETGTRPIVTLDESNSRIQVYYTSKEAGGDIVYKESSASNINFSKQHSIMIKGTFNNVSSTKDPYKDNNVIIASDEKQVVGTLILNY